MSITTTPSIDEREWQAQEDGMRAAHGDAPAETGSSTDLPAAANYRLVAQALRSSPANQPPADFADDVAQLAAVRSDAGFEHLLSQVLVLAFTVSLLVVAALYGQRWWQLVHQALGGDALAWLLPSLVCLGVSWVVGQLQPIRTDAGIKVTHWRH